MKSLTFSILLCFSFLCFSNTAFGQMDKTEKKVISYDPEVGDWDIVIPVPVGLIPDKRYEMFISANGVWNLPAELTKRGFELIHPSKLYLNEGIDYSFKAVFVDTDYNVQETEPITLWAPDLEINLYWEAVNYKLSTKVSVDGMNDFYPNMEQSYFYTIDVLWDSIRDGSNKNFGAIYLNNNEFVGEKNISTRDVACDKQYLGFLLRLDNDDGQERLRGDDLSSFMVEGFFVITHNLTGVGAVTPYMLDNKPRKAYILNSIGQTVEEVVLQSDQPYWLPESTLSGKYFVVIPDGGFTTGQIMKINN